MTSQEIINKWLVYAEYDPNKKNHNVLSVNYEMHKICEKIKGILDYDPNGVFAVLFAKSAFLKLMKTAKVSAFDVLTNPEYLRDEKEMISIFCSQDVQRLEQDLLGKFDHLLETISPIKRLGDRDLSSEKAALMESIEVATTQLQECKIDLFKKGGEIHPIKNYSTHIHVFNRLSECLLAVESARMECIFAILTKEVLLTDISAL